MAITMAVPWERSRYGVTEARTGAIIANLAELMTTLIAPMMAKSVGVGDRVIFRQFSGTKMEWMGMDYLLINEEDIQAKVMG